MQLFQHPGTAHFAATNASATAIALSIAGMVRAPGSGREISMRDYRELDVWKLCDQLRTEMRKLLGRSCFDRDIDLRNQLRRASERPCPVIAEGFGRYHPIDNAKFVRDAKASLSEIIEHMSRAVAQGFVTQDEANVVITLCKRGRGAATGYIRYLETAEAPGVRRTRRTRARA